jgi:hypothetical protein
VAFAVALLALVSLPREARADTAFAAGSLIIPMDTDYQDNGMLKAFGLLDALLRADVPINWVIKTPKAVVNASMGQFEADFTASAKDLQTDAVITAHGYRGGPFVIDSSDAAKATPIITNWQKTNTTAVHVATAPFTGYVSRRMLAAPKIAILDDGNSNIAFNYLNAAGILDELRERGARHSFVMAARRRDQRHRNAAEGRLPAPARHPRSTGNSRGEHARDRADRLHGRR